MWIEPEPIFAAKPFELNAPPPAAAPKWGFTKLEICSSAGITTKAGIYFGEWYWGEAKPCLSSEFFQAQDPPSPKVGIDKPGSYSYVVGVLPPLAPDLNNHSSSVSYQI